MHCFTVLKDTLQLTCHPIHPRATSQPVYFKSDTKFYCGVKPIN